MTAIQRTQASAPTVSIIIPVYQGAAFLPETLASCRKALADGVVGEIVAVDDGSTDGSRSILEAAGPPVRVLPGAPRSGRNSARNRGLEAASGRYVKFLDQDDLLEPRALREEVGLAESQSADLVVSATRIAARDGSAGRVVPALDPARGIDGLLAGQSALTAAVLYRRSYLLEQQCRWTDAAGKLDDWRFLLTTVLAGGKVCARPGIAYTWILHPTQVSGQATLLENAVAFYGILDWFESELSARGELTETRSRRLAQYRYKEVSVLARFAPDQAERVITQILTADPQFVPYDEESRSWMRLAVRCLGLRRALRAYATVRAAWRGAEVRAATISEGGGHG